MPSRGRVPGTPRRRPPLPAAAPRYLPLRRLQLRGRCRRLRLTRGGPGARPPRPPSAQRREGPARQGEGLAAGSPWLRPPTAPARGHRGSAPPVAGGRGGTWTVGAGGTPEDCLCPAFQPLGEDRSPES